MISGVLPFGIPWEPVEIFNDHEKLSHFMDYRLSSIIVSCFALYRTHLTLTICEYVLWFIVNTLNSADNHMSTYIANLNDLFRGTTFVFLMIIWTLFFKLFRNSKQKSWSLSHFLNLNCVWFVSKQSSHGVLTLPHGPSSYWMCHVYAS